MLNKISKIAIISTILLLNSQNLLADWGADLSWIDDNRPDHALMNKGFSTTNNIVNTKDHNNNIALAIKACKGNDYCVVKVEATSPGMTFNGFTIKRSKTKILGVNKPIIKAKYNQENRGIYVGMYRELDKITIEGLTLESHDFKSKAFVGFEISGIHINDVLIKGNTAKGLHSNYDGCIVCIIGNGDTEAKAIKNISINNNIFESIKTVNSEVISIGGNSKNWEIKNNIVSQIDFIAIAVGGGYKNAPYAVDAARYGYIENNNIDHVNDNLSSNGSDGQGIGIYVDGGRKILIQDNTVLHSPVGYSIGAEECIITRDIVLRKNSSQDSLDNRGYASLWAGAFTSPDTSSYTGFDKKSSNPYETWPCNIIHNSGTSTKGKGYVEHITVIDNDFDKKWMVPYLYETIVRLNHAVIQEGIGFTSINTENAGEAPQGKPNENAIIYPQEIGKVTAHDDAVSVIKGETITIDVLANDSSSKLTVYWVDDTWVGNIKIVNNKLVYKSNNTYSGTLQIWYGVKDSNNSEDWAMVTITITAASSFRVENDTATTIINKPVTIDVLANDTGKGLSIGSHSVPQNGVVNVSKNKLIYTPNDNYTGVDNFWCQVVDSSGKSGKNLIKVTVKSNEPKILQANNDTATVSRNKTVIIDAIANDTGMDLVLEEIDDTWTGSAEIVGNKIIYTADDETATGLDLWYSVTDSNNNEEWARVIITIN